MSQWILQCKINVTMYFFIKVLCYVILKSPIAPKLVKIAVFK